MVIKGFPGHKSDTLDIMVNFKFAGGAYFVDKGVEHVTSLDICSAIAGNVDPDQDIQSQIPGLPSAIARDFLLSDVRVVVIKHEDLAHRLEAFKEQFLKANKEEFLKWPENELNHFLDTMEEDIKDVKKTSTLGCFYPGETLVNRFFGGPVIIVYDLENNKGSEHLNRMNMASTLQHEIGHAIDFINGGSQKYLSDSPSFHWNFEKHFLSNAPDRPFLYHVADINFLDHCKSYEDSEKPVEVVAEVISKYAHTYNMHPQIAEMVTNHDFPYIWPEIKEMIPQIEESLIGQGYDRNARPLYSTPSLYIMNEKYFSRPDEDGYIHLPIFGFSTLEKQKLKEMLSANDIDISERHEYLLDWYVFHESDLPNLEALREQIKGQVDLGFFEQTRSSEFLKHIRSEEQRISKLLPSVKAVDVRVGFDGNLLLSMSKNFNPAERLSYMASKGFQFNDDFEVYSSSPDHISYVVPYDQIPDLYKPNLNYKVTSSSDIGGFTPPSNV